MKYVFVLRSRAQSLKLSNNFRTGLQCVNLVMILSTGETSPSGPGLLAQTSSLKCIGLDGGETKSVPDGTRLTMVSNCNDRKYVHFKRN